jgi:hypothetical protein
MRKPKTKSPKARQPVKPAAGPSLIDNPGEQTWAPRPALRKRCGGVSAVTWWRWTRDPSLNFPQGRLVNNRWYYPVAEVMAWWNARPQQRATQ